jgi:tubulin alpha
MYLKRSFVEWCVCERMEQAGAREDVTLLGKDDDQVAAETVEGGDEEEEEVRDASLQSTSTHFAF